MNCIELQTIINNKGLRPGDRVAIQLQSSLYGKNSGQSSGCYDRIGLFQGLDTQNLIYIPKDGINEENREYKRFFRIIGIKKLKKPAEQ